MLLLALIVSSALVTCAWGADEEGKGGQDIPSKLTKSTEEKSRDGLLITPFVMHQCASSAEQNGHP